MRARVNRLSLVGIERTFLFEPGVNIVTGPIASGKTSLLRLTRGLFAGPLNDLPPEVREGVSAIGGEIVVGEDVYSVVRANVTTASAKVEIAGTREVQRLPVAQLDETATMTYGQWLLTKLGLPRLEVPSAPTRAESAPTPVSVNDYFLYCELPQDEIDSSIFGHRHVFKNIKRRYVFEILYGLYDVDVARIQDELRDVYISLRQLQSQTMAFERFLADTPWENRAALHEALSTARRTLNRLEEETVQHAETAVGGVSIPTQELRASLRSIDEELAKLRLDQERETDGVDRLRRLVAQLESQTERLTRSIVANLVLTDFEFVVCPRCGSEVDSARGNLTTCSLCLQTPEARITRESLVQEQERIGAQIIETRELIAAREKGLHKLELQIGDVERRRREVGRELDVQLRSYVSDSATEIARRAGERSDVQSTIRRLEDYLTLYAKMDRAMRDIESLDRRRRELEGEFEAAGARRGDAESRILRLEEKFEEILDAFGVPRFGKIRKAAIDRSTYLPVLDGRRFDELSSQGLQVLVNVAHALAHHEVAIELSIPLPGILMIDGVTKNVGHEGFDLERVEAVYSYLNDVSARLGDALQILIADNDVPEGYHHLVKVRLSEAERLVPSRPSA
ncbi:MAG: hypothetical protein HY525_09610 [Betaproteobacteria bacterium]|nr:hypothetical protein [Betaproteobacteria bacterium]